MRKCILLCSALAFSAGFLTVSWDRAVHPSRASRKINPHSVDAMRSARLQFRIDRRSRGWSKPDSPGEYVRYFHSIMTPDDAPAPQYPPNYRIEEFRRAHAHIGAFRKAAASLPWIERGPGNVGGRTRAIVVDPDDPMQNTWFAAAVSGGVWKTNNAGASWTSLSSTMSNLATTCLAMAPSNHDVLYAGTGEGFFNTDAVRGNGIWRTTDRGATWIQLPSTATSADFWYVNRLIIDPANADIVVAATNTALFRTANGGASWTRVASPGSRVQHVLANPLNFRTQFAGANNVGIFRSYDGGITWAPVFIPGTSGRIELAISPTDTARLYAIQDQTGVSALSVSTDGGSSWSLVPQASGAVNWLGSQGWYDNTAAVHPFDPNILFVGGIDVYRISIGAGSSTPFAMSSIAKLTNWYPDGIHPFVHADHHALLAVPTGPSSFLLLNGNDGGVELSRDGGTTWSKTLNGYNTTQFYGADKMHGADRYFGGMQDNGTWYSGTDPDRLTAWSELIGGDGFDVSWHYGKTNQLLGSVYYNALYRSLDHGVTWASADRGLNDHVSGSAPFITVVAKSNIDPDLLFAVGKSGIWRSDDFAASWSLVPIPASDWSDGTTGRAAISLKNTQIVWAGVRMASMGKLHVSTDGGYTFHPVSLYPNATLGRLSGLTTHPTEDSTAFAIFSFAGKPKILRTTDLGVSWTDISGFGSQSSSSNGFPDVAVYSLLVMPHKPNEIWAGTEIGLFISTDNGGSWTYADNGLPPAAVWQLRVVDDEIVAATHGRGIWSVAIPELLTSLPPAAPLAPRLTGLAVSADGDLSIGVSLRSAYDSSVVFTNGMREAVIGANVTPRDTVLHRGITQAESVSVRIISYKSGSPNCSATKTMFVQPSAPARFLYAQRFDAPTTDFEATGFSMQTPSGFLDGGYHTPHPYANQSEYLLALNIPIIVGNTSATIAFDEVAIVEPGMAGAPFGSLDFYDYCVVEATRDGLTWTPLEDGYDARRVPEWLAAWTGNAGGSASLMRTHTIDLLTRYLPGDRIRIRFRMFTDPGAVGWGWMIDNLLIQTNTSDTILTPAVPNEFRLVGNYPNPLSPFNPGTTIAFRIAEETQVTLKIFDMRGRLIATLVDGRLSPKEYAVRWDAHGQASGIYFYRLEAGNPSTGSGRVYSQTRKLVLLK